MAKHTPGPWDTSSAGNGMFRIGAQNCWIAMVSILRHGYQLPEEIKVENQANAALIAAAPDLLEALKFVLDHIADPERGVRELYPAFGLDANRAVEMVRAAIDKAEGK